MKNADALLIKSITVLIYSTLALLVLSFLLALSLPLFLNPNHYKGQIADRVLEKTGRRLTFSGPVELDLFPDPTLTLEQLSLGNAPGFGPEPMVNIQRIHGRLRLRDLLKLQFVLENVTVTGVEVFLEQRAGGQNNWDDLVTHAVAANTAAGQPLPADLPDNVLERAASQNTTSPIQLGMRALSVLSARSITIQEGSVRLCRPYASAEDGKLCPQATHLSFMPRGPSPKAVDRTATVQVEADLTTHDPPFVGHVFLSYQKPAHTSPTTTQWRGAKLSVRGQVNMPPAKELELLWLSDIVLGPEPNRLHIAQADSKLTVWSDAALFREFTLTLKGGAEADIHTGKLQLPPGGISWRLKSDQLPPAGVELAFQSAIEMDLQQETIAMAGLQVTGPAQIRMEGHLQGSHLFSNPSVDAELTAFRFDPRALLVAMGRSVPPASDPAALRSATGSAVIHLDEQALAITRMVLNVDNSRLTGDLSWRADGQTATAVGRDLVRFDVQADRLNLDGYLPPELTDPGQGNAVVQTLLAPELLLPELPPRWLQNLDLQGSFRLGELRINKTQAADLSLVVKVRDRQLQLHPYRLTLYGGEMESRLLWDGQGEEPRLTLDKSATEVQIEPLLRLLPYAQWLGGRANLAIHLDGRGQNADLLWKNMSGTLVLTVQDGQMQGMDLAERFRESYAGSQEKRPFIAGAEKPVTEKRGVTPFSKLTATGRLSNGLLESQDLRLLSPGLTVTGKGWVDLGQAAVEYTLEVDGTALLANNSVALPNSVTMSGQRQVLPLRFQGDLNLLKSPVVGPIRSQ
ncbi:MAG: AsmA family protein [Magnetococcales bacterium]|nr:AsmA family protein [Magnetococcales bacterium]